MERVLLTGGAGFIGSHTAVCLMEQGYHVVIADDLSNAAADVPERIEKITGQRPDFYPLDVADRGKLEELFEKEAFDAVIHFAGFKAVGESVAQPLKYYRNNLDTTLTLLETMQRHGVKRFVFSSSATVYGNNNEPPFTEDMPTGACTNPYGRTKYMIEEILKDACVADPELSVVLLRYFNPVGAHASGLIGEKPTGIPNNLMPYVTQVAAGIRKELSVFGNDYPTPDGTGVRDYIHVLDLAAGHEAALRFSATQKGAAAINLGTGKGVSVLELVQAFEKANGLTIPYRIAPRRPGDIASCYADTAKAKQLLGWEAKRGIEDMCRDAWNFEKKLREEA